MLQKIIGDPTYHRRHNQRNIARARDVSESISIPISSILDIGCNAGDFSIKLLQKFPNATCTGVEVAVESIDQALLDDPRFHLSCVDVVRFSPEHRYDVVVYGAVHHHVVAHYGLKTSLEVLSRLVNHCDKYLFFETGQLTEGSRWYWHQAIASHFSSDEDHIHCLVSSLGRRISAVDIVGSHWIHGSRRWLLRLSIDHPYSNSDSGLDNQKVIEVSKCQPVERCNSPARHSVLNTVYRCSYSGNNRDIPKSLFVKEWVNDTDTPFFEFNLGRYINHQAAVNPIGRSDFGALIFPFVRSKDGSLDFIQLKSFFEYVRQCKVEPNILPKYLPNDRRSYRMIDVIDINTHNVIMEIPSNRLRVVDFEYFSPTSKLRNKLNFGLLLIRARKPLPGYTIWVYAAIMLVARAMADSFRSPAQRITLKRPSLLGMIYARFRDYSDRLIMLFVPSYKE